ncbi:heme exporter protein CcmD (plasmid) [Cupriavidus necator H16]|uniref:Heme exporter protein D n=1 Tax=Cupriavidus necator (strain ATCC 17699 / DSM 428 / KCTC 22496 / NCIMB 10442 / H16 / Stanier 337) TaxID=381666 RepID=A0AAF1D5G5_CUPNH|nr:heme exporter protein CcmD [Cupriavidus necator]QCC05462.1 heme exporter protein CcmD [Cupriavidus necator H16]QQB81283.1 heme exporter protein CcmD [Cupriavidus necator]
MNWSALSSFTGHAAYIVGAFGMAFALLAIELFLLARRARAGAGPRR